jgi:hypothetical protein
MMKKWRRKGFVLGLRAAVESQTQLMIMCFSLERDHSKSGCPAAACSPTDSICRTVALSDLKLNVSLFWFETRWVCRVLYHRLECGARCVAPGQTARVASLITANGIPRARSGAYLYARAYAGNFVPNCTACRPPANVLQLSIRRTHFERSCQ